MFRQLCFLMITCCSLFSENYAIFEEDSNAEVSNAIVMGLKDFNDRIFEKKYSVEFTPFVIYARDENSKVIGGLTGFTCCGSPLGSWASVDYAWVDENRRNQGIGTQLFERLEALAESKDCSYIQLYTMDYQAVGFYKKLGFECIGVISKWVENHDVVYLRKPIVKK